MTLLSDSAKAGMIRRTPALPTSPARSQCHSGRLKRSSRHRPGALPCAHAAPEPQGKRRMKGW